MPVLFSLRAGERHEKNDSFKLKKLVPRQKIQRTRAGRMGLYPVKRAYGISDIRLEKGT